MKRLLMTLGLTLALVLTVGGLAVAAPLAGGNQGDILVFGQYGTGGIPVIGAGYGLSDGFVAGIELNIDSTITYGAFLTIAFEPILVTADIAEGACKVAALYMMDLDMVTLGVGAGAFFGGGSTFICVEGGVSMAVADNMTVFGSIDYFIEGGGTIFAAGVSMVF